MSSANCIPGIEEQKNRMNPKLAEGKMYPNLLSKYERRQDALNSEDQLLEG